MRVTPDGILQRMLAGADRRWSEIGRLEGVVASGRRVQQPQDDPVAYRAALSVDRAIALAKGAGRALDAAASRLAATENALHELGTLLTRARALAVRMTNGGVTAAERQAAAAEARHLRDEALAAANRRWRDEALFGGTSAAAAPYAIQAGAVTYTGDAGQRTVAVAPGRSVAAGVVGGAPELRDALAALQALADGLAAGKADLGPELGALTQAQDGVVRLTAETGARLASVRNERQAWNGTRAALEKERAQLVDADLPAAMARLAEARNALEALYLALARMRGLSLANWLR